MAAINAKVTGAQTKSTAPALEHSEPVTVPQETPPADEGALTYAQVATAIEKATSRETLEIARDLIRSVEDGGHQRELSELAEKRAEYLQQAA